MEKLIIESCPALHGEVVISGAKNSSLPILAATILAAGRYHISNIPALRDINTMFKLLKNAGIESSFENNSAVLINNDTQEPEVQDLADFLRKMGAEIEGDGTNTITIHGVSNLHSADHQVMADRIEAGTFLCAVAGAGGDITLKKCPVYALDAVIEKLRLAGLEVNIIDNETINAKMNGKIKAVNVQTAPYPAFPTDMQAQFMAVMLKSDGVSVINESIFENRFMHVPELKRMGADISLNDSNAVVKGVKAFSGAPVMASDLRASAGLVIAALMADHTSSVHRIYHLDRGYEGFEKKLNSLGAKIVRTEDNE